MGGGALLSAPPNIACAQAILILSKSINVMAPKLTLRDLSSLEPPWDMISFCCATLILTQLANLNQDILLSLLSGPIILNHMNKSLYEDNFIQVIQCEVA